MLAVLTGLVPIIDDDYRYSAARSVCGIEMCIDDTRLCNGSILFHCEEDIAEIITVHLGRICDLRIKRIHIGLFEEFSDGHSLALKDGKERRDVGDIGKMFDQKQFVGSVHCLKAPVRIMISLILSLL